jgi:hypothetical protein
MNPPSRAFRRIALALTLTVMVGGVHAQDSILPGYWETTDHFLGSAKTERRCVLPKDIAKVMGGPSNHIYACNYPRDSIGGGKISFRGECVDKKGRRFQLSGHGVYTHTTLQMSADVTSRLLGLPVTLSASTDAHWIGDVCPAGSPGSQSATR